MKKIIAILLLLLVVGCGDSEQAGSLAKCPDCGEKVSKRAAACPSCGSPLNFALEAEQEAVAALEKLGATIFKFGPDNPSPDGKSTGRVGLVILQGLAITDADLVHLKPLTRMGGLDLTDTQITDKGLVHLKGLTNLADVGLSGTKITDAGLEHLKTLTNLDQLELGGTQVTEAGWLDLQKVLPKMDPEENYFP